MLRRRNLSATGDIKRSLLDDGHEVAVAVAVVDAGDGGPELLLVDPLEREGCLGVHNGYLATTS